MAPYLEGCLGGDLCVLAVSAVRYAAQSLSLPGLQITAAALNIPEHSPLGIEELEMNERRRRRVARVLDRTDHLEATKRGVLRDLPAGQGFVLADGERLADHDLARRVLLLVLVDRFADIVGSLAEDCDAADQTDQTEEHDDPDDLQRGVLFLRRLHRLHRLHRHLPLGRRLRVLLCHESPY